MSEPIKMAPSHPNHPVLSDEELLDLSVELIGAIERCGASIELTNAVTVASALNCHLERYIRSKAEAAKALDYIERNYIGGSFNYDFNGICVLAIQIHDSVTISRDLKETLRDAIDKEDRLG